MLQADGIVYFYLFLFIIRCVTPETHDKRCVREGKTREEKGNCSDSASLRRAGEILARPGGIQSGFLICLKHRNGMIRNDKRCSCPSSWGHRRKLAKISIPNRLYQVFDQVGKSFSDYKPETNWCTKCKVEADKKFKEQRKYIPRKRKTCNKQKVEQFSTLISVSSRCAS